MIMKYFHILGFNKFFLIFEFSFIYIKFYLFYHYVYFDYIIEIFMVIYLL